MLITVVCPTCQTHYQVQPTLRGKPMRCPNAKCRKVFVVPDGEADKTRRPSPSASQRSGSVGDLVPILPAEENVRPAVPTPAALPPKPRVPVKREPEKAAPSWLDAPPPVRGGGAVRNDKVIISEDAAQSWDSPPPVRRGKEADAIQEMTPEPAVVEKEPEPLPRRGRGKANAIIAALILLVLGGLGVAGFYVWHTKETQKSEAFDEALAIYKNGGYREAADKFKELQDNASDDRKDSCRFYESLARLRADLEAPEAGGDPLARTTAALSRISDFINEQQGKKLLNDNAHDLGETLVKVAAAFGKDAVPAKDSSPLAVVEQFSMVKDLLANLNDGLHDEDSAKIEADLNKVRESVALWKRHEDVLAKLKALTANPSLDAIREAARLIKQEDRFPELGQEPAVADIRTQLYEGHFGSITYQEDGADLKPPEAVESLPSVAVTPFVQGLAAPAGEGLDLVMARGVLYALERGSGQFRWAMRIGLDGNQVPLRLPRSAAGRERFLVLVDDATTALIVDDGGALVWHYVLPKPCLGKPLLIDQRAFLPTADGEVHVLDLARGRVQGHYKLGRKLSVGGARQEGTRLVYFPADDTCVFVLDVDKRRCVGILYTGHPAGSLRSEPLIVTPENAGRMTPGYLILNQTAGVDETLLRVFALPTTFPMPLADRLAAPLKLDFEPRLRGWTWFAPHADDEKVAVVTDAGKLGLFGIRQSGNDDPPLFRLLPPESADVDGVRRGLSLDLLLPPDAAGRERAQVVYARGEDLWVQGNGKLQRIQLGWRGKSGRALLPGWRAPVELGLPLQAGQVAEDSVTDRALLLLVTQPLAQQVCLATAVDAETGAIRWQRQLGMVPRTAPLALAAPDDPAPLLLTVDRGGALFLFDPLQYSKLAPGIAQSTGRREAGTVDDNPHMPPILLAGGDGRSAYEVACPGNGRQVLVRQIRRDATERRVKLEHEPTIPLPAPLGGTPGIVGSRLLLPLENGRLVVVKLPLDGSGTREGANWRDARLGSSAHGHVVPLGGDRFLTTDGQRGVTSWRWPEDQQLPLGKKKNRGIIPVTYELKANLAAAPLVLPPEKNLPQRICLIDDEGTATLLDVRPDGDLVPNGISWELHGRVTAGPFLRTLADGTARIGCVMDERRLVWLDPNREVKPIWEYPAEAEIVGQPEMIAGTLVVALRSGVYFGLDPATGKPKGERLSSPPGVPPAISPVPFGPGRLFAPLADGTILLPERSLFGAR